MDMIHAAYTCIKRIAKRTISALLSHGIYSPAAHSLLMILYSLSRRYFYLDTQHPTMRKTLIIICGALLLLSACKKNEKAATAGSWRFADVSYGAASASYAAAANSLSATGADGSLDFYFASKPAQSGNYRIVNYTAIPLDSGQLYIRFINSSTKAYYFSTGADDATAVVTVRSDGKLNITVSNARMAYFASPNTDSVQLVADIVQH